LNEQVRLDEVSAKHRLGNVAQLLA
jgi:hypothetical protein